MNLEIVFAEFGQTRGWNQTNLDENRRLDPTYSAVKQFFPEAKLVLYTDLPELGEGYDVEVRQIDVERSPFDKSHHKWGWHCCDYYQAVGLLASDADIAISMDSDIVFVNEEVRTMLPITNKFGVCVPQNERQLVKVDGIHTRGNDGDYHIDEDPTRGNALTYDLWWMSFKTKNARARTWLTEFARLMATNPKRAPLQMSRAAWNTGVYPYAMPIQWGVGRGDVGCGSEIILHVGHTNVKEHYLGGN
jgi:hypothetical protein